MTKIHHPDDAYRTRAADRIRVDLDAYLGPGRKLPVFVQDLSSQGFRCRCEQRLPIGGEVVLRIPKLGQFPATIAWQLGAHAGARFVSPLPLQTLMRIVIEVVKAEAESIEPKRAAAR